MRLEAKKYLYDIQQAAMLAAQFTASKQFEDYQRDPMLRLAVERAFAIIGEALSQLARLDAVLAAQIREHRSIIAFRNILIHIACEEIKATRRIVLYPGDEEFKLDAKTEVMPLRSLLAAI